MMYCFLEFQLYKGDILGCINGLLIFMEIGIVIFYSINNLQDCGKFFISVGDEIYEGQVVGENSCLGDFVVNFIKIKKLINMCFLGVDDKMKFILLKVFMFEEVLEYIQEDEFVEVMLEFICLCKILFKEYEWKCVKNKVLVQ